MIRASVSRPDRGGGGLAPFLNGAALFCSATVQTVQPNSVAMIRMLASALVLIAAFAAAPAFADDAARADTVAEFQELISTSQAVAAARRAHPRADVLNARLVNGNRPYYSVRMMQDGRRFDVRVDARTGRVLN